MEKLNEYGERTELIDFEQFRKDIVKLLHDTHAIQQIKDGIDYTGIDITMVGILSTSTNIKQAMTTESLAWQRTHGYTMLDIIVEKIFQLGFEQGCIYSAIENKEDSETEEDLDAELMELYHKRIGTEFKTDNSA